MAPGTGAASTPEPLLRTGRGAPLLLLHGVLLTWQSWIPVIDDLRADHDILAPTLPGHHGGPAAAHPATVAGLADWAEALMDETGWRTAHIVGNSLGGWIALELAARGRARTVTAISPAGVWKDPSSADALVRKFRGMSPLIGFGSDTPPVLPGMIRSLLLPLLAHHPGTVAPQLARAMAAAPAHCTILDDLAEDPALPTGFTGLSDLTIPTAVLLPEFDRVLPPRLYPLLAPTPALEIHPLPGLGHVPMLEAPARITAEIRATIARESAVRSA
ncbi:alpha/beta fold hydrolase [Nocardia sp. NBC_01503]|uniref:alpha/beta fold hydrolase n=1 Tax=Nocardia sp. NBC_01503 TaxID=2975997 RepID=UPI002E7C4250|nr:alpha/beta fold hydrolase [Nocardia sp. NBC_01503]WTL34934.1 alpha/beta fold hydrolase [Nocardia sp. NBC_01503]